MYVPSCFIFECLYKFLKQFVTTIFKNIFVKQSKLGPVVSVSCQSLSNETAYNIQIINQ